MFFEQGYQTPGQHEYGVIPEGFKNNDLKKKSWSRIRNTSFSLPIEDVLPGAVSALQPKVRRGSSRIKTKNMDILLRNGLRELPVLDISTKGMCVRHMNWNFQSDEFIHFDLMTECRVLITNIRARVVRQDFETIGCVFENLTLNVTNKLYYWASQTFPNCES